MGWQVKRGCDWKGNGVDAGGRVGKEQGKVEKPDDDEGMNSSPQSTKKAYV